jgi:plasmid stability protein
MTPWGHHGSMPDVTVRGLPDSVVTTLENRVRQAGRSLEEELRILLMDAAKKPEREVAAEVKALRAMLRRKYGTLSDSTEGIREDREARG